MPPRWRSSPPCPLKKESLVFRHKFCSVFSESPFVSESSRIAQPRTLPAAGPLSPFPVGPFFFPCGPRVYGCGLSPEAPLFPLLKFDRRLHSNNLSPTSSIGGGLCSLLADQVRSVLSSSFRTCDPFWPYAGVIITPTVRFRAPWCPTKSTVT